MDYILGLSSERNSSSPIALPDEKQPETIEEFICSSDGQCGKQWSVCSQDSIRRKFEIEFGLQNLPNYHPTRTKKNTE